MTKILAWLARGLALSSLRGRLRMLVWVAILPLALLVIAENIHERGRQEAAVRENARTLVNLAAGNLEQYINKTRPALLAISLAEVMQSGDPAAIAAFLREMHQRYPEYANFGVVDLQGRVFAGSVEMPKPVNASEMFWFKQTVKNRTFTVGECQIGRITGLEMIVFSQPVFDHAGQLRFLLFAGMDINWLIRLWENIRLLPDPTLTITDRNGVVLFRYPPAGDQWIGKRPPQAAFTTTMLSEGRGMVEARGLDNRPRIYAFTSTGAAPGTIHLAVGVSRAAALAPLNQTLLINLAALALVGMLSLLLANSYAKRFILKALKVLQDGATAFAAGDYSRRLNLTTGEDEFIACAGAFDKMAEKIEANIRGLQVARTIIDKSNDAIFLVDSETGRILDANAQAAINTGYSRSELLDLHIMDLDTLVTDQALWQEHAALIREQGSLVFETCHRRKDGTTLPVEINISHVATADQNYTIGIVRDITKRRQAEDKIRTLNRVYAVTSRINQAIVQIREQEQFLHEACRIAVEDGKFHMAWVGMADADSNLVEPVAHGGAEEGYLTEIKRVSILDVPEGRGPTGTAIREGRYCISHDIAGDPGMAPWREEALKRGYRSSIALPLKTFGKTIGAFSLYATTLNFIVPEEIALLEAVTNNISFALEAMEVEKRRRLTEEALRENEARLKIALSRIDLTVFNQDLELRYTWMYPPPPDYTMAQLVGRSDGDLLPPEAAPQVIELKRGVLANRSGVRREVEFIREGRSCCYDLLVEPLCDAAGEMVGIMGASLDISEHKRTAELIKNILETVDEGFIIIDREFRIISANRAYAAGVKMPLEEIIGKPCYEVSHQFSRPCHESAGHPCTVHQVFETGEPAAAEHTHYDKDGNPVYVETKAYPLAKDHHGNIITAIEIVTDVTEKRALEAQLRQAHKMEAVGQLAGGIAHDFNNILTSIIGYSSLLIKALREDDLNLHMARMVLESGERAASLTRSLLTFSRKQPLALSTVDINETLREVELLLRRLIGADIDFRVKPAETELAILVDVIQIKQLLINLATNAQDAMPSGGALTISAEPARLDKHFLEAHGYGKPGRYALITVADTGTGMDKETQLKIFEPFFSTKEFGKGTGLGLSIAYGIVKEHQGFINVHSEPGIGSTFRIYLPLAGKATIETSLAEIEIAKVKGGSETILVAEDDNTVRHFTKIVLERSGYRVIEAVDGEEAVNKFRAQPEQIDLLLFDMIMPKLDGMKAYERIREIRPGVKALFTSGYTRELLMEKYGLDEDLGFVYKPISPTALLKKVRETLEKGEE